MRFTKGDNKDFAPMLPIRVHFKFRVKLERLMRFVKGDNID